jgi:flagellar basal-body rod protein FlgF
LKKAGGVRDKVLAMIYGLYLSGQGAQAQSSRLSVVANNIANASTGAFKRDLAIFRAHRPRDVENGLADEPPGNLNEMTGGVSLAEIATDFSNGPLTKTGGTYDLALAGAGFLAVSDGSEQFLTRNGQLSVNEQGVLVSQETGLAVVGVGDSSIVIPPDAQGINIAGDGSVFATNPEGQTEQIGRIAILQPESYNELEKIGRNLYRASGRTRPADDSVRILQGHLEESGVQPVLEMMEMIEASRAFETNVNMIRIQDESLGQLMQSVRRR